MSSISMAGLPKNAGTGNRRHFPEPPGRNCSPLDHRPGIYHVSRKGITCRAIGGSRHEVRSSRRPVRRRPQDRPAKSVRPLPNRHAPRIPPPPGPVPFRRRPDEKTATVISGADRIIEEPSLTSGRVPAEAALAVGVGYAQTAHVNTHVHGPYVRRVFPVRRKGENAAAARWWPRTRTHTRRIRTARPVAQRGKRQPGS